MKILVSLEDIPDADRALYPEMEGPTWFQSNHLRHACEEAFLARKRPERRDSYHDFPSSYAELLNRFDKHGIVRLKSVPLKDALAMQAAIYRYAGFLRNAPPDDVYAAELSEIANRMRCRRIANGDGSVTLEFYPDPLVAMMADFKEQPT